MNNEYIYLWADKKDQIQDWENNQYIVLKYVLGWWIKKVKRNIGYVSNIKMVIFSLLICTLRTAFEDGRKVVLVEDPEEKLSLYYKLNFFSRWRTRTKSEQNHLSDTLKITSKGTD